MMIRRVRIRWLRSQRGLFSSIFKPFVEGIQAHICKLRTIAGTGNFCDAIAYYRRWV